MPVTDLAKATAFYNAVFKTELNLIEDMGPNPIAMFATKGPEGVAGHLYPGTPPARGTGPTVHMSVPDSIDETAGRLKDAGGAVVSETISIPAGQFMYCLDPDGNSISLFKFNETA
nr:VOC family protein [Roseibium sp. RKSG952]